MDPFMSIVNYFLTFTRSRNWSHSPIDAAKTIVKGSSFPRNGICVILQSPWIKDVLISLGYAVAVSIKM